MAPGISRDVAAGGIYPRFGITKSGECRAKTRKGQHLSDTGPLAPVLHASGIALPDVQAFASGSGEVLATAMPFLERLRDLISD